MVRRLSGAYLIDHHTASQCDPLCDLEGRDWHEPWRAPLAQHLTMPRPVWPTDVVGAVTADSAAATGLPVGTPV